MAAATRSATAIGSSAMECQPSNCIDWDCTEDARGGVATVQSHGQTHPDFMVRCPRVSVPESSFSEFARYFRESNRLRQSPVGRLGAQELEVSSQGSGRRVAKHRSAL